MQAFGAQDLLQEEVGKDALAHEPALQVGEHAQHGVDLARRRQFLELLRAEHALDVHVVLLLRPPAVNERGAAAVSARRAPSRSNDA